MKDVHNPTSQSDADLLEEVSDELSEFDEFTPLTTQPPLSDDADDARHEIIGNNKAQKEVVVPIMPLV